MTSVRKSAATSFSPDGRRELHRLFDPRSVAIVGASSHEHKWGYRLAASALSGSDRRDVYLVNRNGGSILGRPVHRSLSELPAAPEVVVITVPAAQFDAVVEEALAAGTRAVVGITAGLGEKGGAAARCERQRALDWRRAGLMMVGPNCAGLADSSSGFRLEFTPHPFGTIGLLSQSGNLIVELSRLIAPLGLGFSRYVSVGNQADLSIADFVEDMVAHDSTKAVACYVEDFRDGRRFTQAAGRAVASGKPVAVLSVGRSRAGSRAALSHTGALVSDHRVVEAACRAAGAELVSTPGELADLLHAWRIESRPASPRVGVLGDGGGHCAIAADVLSSQGLEVNEIRAESRERIASLLPPTATVANPIDIAGAAEIELSVYARLLEAMLDLPDFDAVLLTGYFGGYSLISHGLRDQEENVAREIAGLVQARSSPVVVHSIHPGSPAIAVLRDAGIPAYERIESAVRALSALTRGCRATRAPRHEPPKRMPLARSHGYFAARAMIAEAGIPQVPAQLVTGLDDAVKAADELGYPVVLKALGAQRKSDAGAVTLGISTRRELERAFAATHARTAASEFSIEKMARTANGIEMIVGARRDPTFGWLVIIGLGGIYADVLDDVAVCTVPVSAYELERRVLALRCAPLLTGARARPRLDLSGLCRAAVALGELAARRDDLDVVEINPLLVLPHGVLGLDARVSSLQLRGAFNAADGSAVMSEEENA